MSVLSNVAQLICNNLNIWRITIPSCSMTLWFFNHRNSSITHLAHMILFALFHFPLSRVLLFHPFFFVYIWIATIIEPWNQQVAQCAENWTEPSLQFCIDPSLNFEGEPLIVIPLREMALSDGSQLHAWRYFLDVTNHGARKSCNSKIY